MENSSQHWRDEAGSPPLIGPAMSPGRPARIARAASTAEPLPPFVRPARRAEVPAAEPLPWLVPPAEEVEEGPEFGEAETATWLRERMDSPVAPAADALMPLPAAPPEPSEPSEPLPAMEEAEVAEDGLGLVRGADWGFADLGDELDVEITDLLWEERPAAEPVSAAPGPEAIPGGEEEAPTGPAPAPPMEAESPDVPEAWSSTAPLDAPEPVSEASLPPEPTVALSASEGSHKAVPSVETALADAMQVEDGPVLAEVAGRLERIAHALREGRPIELFAAGASDPLEVLIAGYALGYSEAYRRVKEERRTGQ